MGAGKGKNLPITSREYTLKLVEREKAKIESTEKPKSAGTLRSPPEEERYKREAKKEEIPP